MKKFIFYFEGHPVEFFADTYNPTQIMVNATQLVGIFKKDTSSFINLPETIKLIEVMLRGVEDFPGRKIDQIIRHEKDKGYYYNGLLSLHLAKWLDEDHGLFLWVMEQKDNILDYFKTHLEEFQQV